MLHLSVKHAFTRDEREHSHIIIFYICTSLPPPDEVMSWSCWFVSHSARQRDYLQINKQICIKLLPEVCPGQMNRLLNFGDDPDYDPDQEFEFPVYDVDRAAKACSL